ncbi:39S mitochondrial ribosomal protein L46-domain-containing protein [Diplogelasinospora grovesii]|uniref:Large ribosomal subunit protein mL46 n=1 Tax=Diplogelasinospora grovesii TaxID=303347 RepID=A0AAN6S1E9_9PEZI|nr:39S mitochondrial ribosomal protein L46-domain-containing protein [Diplogelasinospora grovesii]
MSASSRGGRALSSLLRSQHTRQTSSVPRRVCIQCANTTTTTTTTTLLQSSRRAYSATATAAAEPSSSSSPIPPPPVTTSSPSASQQSQDVRYRIKSGIILTRPPLLTRQLTPFESAFFLYQKRLNERLTAPFRKEFYFKQDTATDLDWKIKLKERHGVPAKDIGRYNPRGRMGWNDEVMVGSTTSDHELGVVQKLLHDAEARVSEDGEEIVDEADRVKPEPPQPRTTEADAKNDTRRLDRKLDQTLYLVVKRKGAAQKTADGKGGDEDVWTFPAGDVPTHEALHETAARVLAESAGVNMNTWIVGRVPVAHYIQSPPPTTTTTTTQDSSSSSSGRGEKVFFLKGRIMAGQADLAGNKHGYTDFKWLTKDELKDTLEEDYYRSVRNMFELR